MSGNRPKVGLACSEPVFQSYIDPADVRRLEARADFLYQAFRPDGSGLRAVPRDAGAEAKLGRYASGLDVLVVCHRSPFVSGNVLDSASRLSLLGELEGDRLSYHFCLDAAVARGLRAVDTTRASSWPTAEWALALAQL
jgi:hypothetical protein